MGREQPERVSREAASKAGKRLQASEGLDEEALAIAHTWRVQHLEPTARCFEALSSCSHQFEGAVVSYRLKRMKSILRKLQREESRFKLGVLDDIGGCRLIVNDVEEVYRAATELERILGKPKVKDYIAVPQRSGYRSYHAIYKVPVSGISYRVEVQIRTRLQHLWATGVEAVGEVYGLEYKSPDTRAKLRGKEQMRDRFLTLSSHLFAREEEMPGIPGVSDDVYSICSEIVEICDITKILKELAVARSGIVVASDVGASDEYFLLCLIRDLQFFYIVGFVDFSEANSEYQRIEKISLGADSVNEGDSREPEFDNVVLVKAAHADAIKRTYLNYSLGVGEFITRLEQLLLTYGAC